MTTAQKKELLHHMMEHMHDDRKELLLSSIEKRTRHITVGLENIYQPQNASAVIRTCDCFGIQDAHIIENSNKYKLNPGVALGSSKWVSMFRYRQNKENTSEALTQLKNKGYRIVATTPHTNDQLISEFNIEQPFALIFGTEKLGLSEVAMDLADEYVKIPMVGFTESFNISVSAAICLYELSNRMRTVLPKETWQLSDNEKTDILIDWTIKSINSGQKIHDYYTNSLKLMNK